jgi:hypothetical protein
MPKRTKSASKALPSTPTTPTEEGSLFHISRYHSSRNFALYEDGSLVTVTVYKKGAEAVQERLEADARTIEDLQGQLAELTTRFRAQATPTPQPSLTEHFNSPIWRPPEQLPLLAAEGMGAYRVTSPCRPAPRR